MHVWNKKRVSWLFNDWYYSPKTCYLWPFPRDELGWSWIHELLDKVDHDKFHRRAYLSLLVFKTNIFGLNNFQVYTYCAWFLLIFISYRATAFTLINDRCEPSEQSWRIKFYLKTRLVFIAWYFCEIVTYRFWCRRNILPTNIHNCVRMSWITFPSTAVVSKR